MGDIIVGIDIGTTKVCTVIGKLNRSGSVEVLGKGITPCLGVKKGTIVDIERTASSVRASVEQAESAANLKIGSAYINIIGMHVCVMSSRNSLSITSDDHEIGRKDVEKLLYSLRDIELEDDRQIIDIIPRQYVIDGYDEIMDPVGMVGVKLEIDADVVAGKITSVQNLVRSLERAGVKPDGIVVEAFATGEMALLPDDRELGVVMIDIGGGVTDVSVFKNGRLRLYNSIPVGGDHITNDIAIGLKISNAEAEKLKRELGLALTSLIKNDQEFTVFDINENSKKSVRVSEIVEIIEARVYEIFLLCRSLLEKEETVTGLGGGVVLAGGGISYMDGGRQLATEVFGLPVRVVSWKHTGAAIPEMITAEGIIKYVYSVRRGNIGSEVKSISQSGASVPLRWLEKIKRFFESLF